MADPAFNYSFRVNDERVRRLLRRYPFAVNKSLRKTLRDTMAFHVRTMKQSFDRFGSVRRGGRSGSNLRARSGALRASIGFETTDGGNRASLFASGPQVFIQEFGGVVKPVKAKFLRVPVPSILTPSGNIRGKFLLRKSGSKFVTDAGETFIHTNKAGRAFIAIKIGKRKRLKVLYILRRQVKIPPRFGFIKTFKNKSVPFGRRRMRRNAREAARELAQSIAAGRLPGGRA